MKSVISGLQNHLPYARRFARALCGNQKSGDAFIFQALEALVEDRAVFERYSEPKIALYATFLQLWNGEAPNGKKVALPTDPALQAADLNLEALSPRPRQVFLLVTLEGFSHSEAAEILGLEPKAVNGLMHRANDDIANQIVTDVLIIEDEPLVAMDLEAAMQEIGHNVLGIATTHDEALTAAKERQPGLVLAGIQLTNGSSGIEAVNRMLTAFEAPVIFVTAFPECLLTGERSEPAFLITKPFDPNVLKAITSQALFFGGKASSI